MIYILFKNKIVLIIEKNKKVFHLKLMCLSGNYKEKFKRLCKIKY